MVAPSFIPPVNTAPSLVSDGWVLTRLAAGSATNASGQVLNGASALDVGSGAVAIAYDLTGDGKPDLLAGDSSGFIKLYVNGGTAFALAGTTGVTNAYGQILLGAAVLDVGSNSAPVMIDIDRDGTRDLVSGDSNGMLTVYRWNGSAFSLGAGALTDGAGRLLDSATGVAIDVGAGSAPTAFDLDADGREDLIVGDSSGFLRAYRNTGTGFTAFAASAWTDGAGRITSGGTPIRADIFTTYASGSPSLYSTPFFADLDRDGRVDLIVGTGFSGTAANGAVLAFRNTGTGFERLLNTPLTDANGFLTTGWPSGTTVLDVGDRSAPTVLDVDGDGRTEIVIGDANGYLTAYGASQASLRVVAAGAAGTVFQGQATDAEGNSLTWSLGGADAACFAIDAATGAVSFVTAPSLAAPTDGDQNGIYAITVSVSDGAATTAQAVTIVVAEAPSVAENDATAFWTGSSSLGGTITWSISGNDAGRFTIDSATGALRATTGLDREAPGDVDRDGAYDILVRATDGTGNQYRPLHIAVTNVDEAPVIGGVTRATVTEGTTGVVYKAGGADPEGAALTWSLSGTDAGLFSINTQTGAVVFKAPPQVATPGDAGADNVYDIVVAASDGVLSTSNAVAITVSTRTNLLVNTLGGTAGFGEQVHARNDDVSTTAIDLRPAMGAAGLNFFGTTFQSLWINNNGSVTFGDRMTSFTPTAITGSTGNPLIAPFWTDVDTSSAAGLAVTTGGNSTGSNRVWWDLDAASRTFTVTWDDVGTFPSKNSPLSAFQLSLRQVNGSGDFDITMRYEDINYASPNGGLSGSYARAGFSAGNGVNFFEFPESGNKDAMLALDTTSNIGVAGIYQFGVRNGTAGDDRTIGTGGDDVLSTLAGNDRAAGGAGNDQIDTGSGNDTADGGEGSDTLRGVDGEDLLAGVGGADSLDGGGGNDTLSGGGGADTLVGGAGDDVYYGGAGSDRFVVASGSDRIGDLGAGGEADVVVVSAGASLGAVLLGSWTATAGTVNAGAATVFGNGFAIDLTSATGPNGWKVNNLEAASGTAVMGSGFADTVIGSDLADTIGGGGGHDDIMARGGDDLVTGGNGNDTLGGGDGKDTLVGGAGQDLLTGGAAADCFRFDAVSDSTSGANRDVIADFRYGGGDRIDLSLIDADTATAGDQAFAWIGTTAFGHVVGQLRFAAGVVQGDVDGDGTADFEIALTGVTAMLGAALLL